jgi:hypothetical protein
MIFTTDRGLNWSNFGLITPGGSNDRIWSIAARPGNIYIAGGSPNAAYLGNPITSWASVGTLPNPGGLYFGNVFAASWITDTDIVLAGSEQNVNSPRVPPVWWSNDSGSTWNQLAGSDIVDYPSSGGGIPGFRTLQRLTRDAVAMGFWNVNISSIPAVVLSLDKGHTFPIK